MPMEITVLASGSSGNCYKVSDGKTTLLLDAGIPIRQIRIGCDFNLTGIDACFVTHSHGDHSKSVTALVGSGINVYMPAEEIKAMDKVVTRRLRRLEKMGDLYETLQVGTMTILPFRVEHDTPEPVGYLVGSNVTGERLLYFTDTFYLRYQFRGLTHIIGECNYDRETMWEKVNDNKTPTLRAKRLFTSHMSLDNFIGFIKANDMSEVKQIYICHMSDDHGNEQKIRETIQRLTGAEVYVC